MENKHTPWPVTKITESLKLKFPIIQAPMAGGITTPELVAAVSNAGGLGSLGGGYMTPDELKIAVQKIKQLTKNPFAVNLFIPEKYHADSDKIDQARHTVQMSCPELNFVIPPINPPYAPSFDAQMQVILEEKIPIFSFTFGIPSENWLEKLRKQNIFLIGTATSLEEAKCLERKGIDAIVAQGSEAGGHRGTFIGKAENSLIDLESLTAELVENIHIPIIAAGGIMNANGIAKALKLGATAVQMGTVFLCCSEANTHPYYKKLLLSLSQENTTLTRAFSGKLARGLKNRFITRMKAFEESIVDYPIQNALTKAMRKEAGQQNNTDFMSMWAGQNAHLCKELSADIFIKELNREMIDLYLQQKML
jgi:nitronate monooxygenase